MNFDYTDIRVELDMLEKEAVDMTDSELVVSALYKNDMFKSKTMNHLLNEYDYEDKLPPLVRGDFERYYVLTEGKLGMKI